MALELIQNADDAGATEIEIEVSESALIVTNNSTFVGCSDIASDEDCLKDAEADGRICDWHSFRDIASGSKAEREASVIGRFGLGFTAVYQVTDNPVVESKGVSLRIEPDKRKGFWDDVTPTDLTKFTLPWATNPNSTVRLKLKSVPGLKITDLDKIHTAILETSAESLIFLKNLKKITITRNGKKKTSFEMSIEEAKNSRRITRMPENKTQAFFFASKPDSENLRQLEEEYPQEIGSKGRQHSTEIAIPIQYDSAYKGLVYAYLPTQRRTSMPLNINGDFFPKHDRKDIILDVDGESDPMAEWNSALIYNAAILLAENIMPLYETLGFKRFWMLVNSIYSLYEDTLGYAPNTPKIFSAFWNRFALTSRSLPIVPLEGREETTVRLQDARLLVGEDVKLKRTAAIDLGLPVVSRELLRHYNVLEQLSVEKLSFEDVLVGLRKSPWTKDRSIAGTDPKIIIDQRYKPLYALLDDCIPKESAGLIDAPLLEEYKSLNLYLTKVNSLMNAQEIYFCERESVVSLLEANFKDFKFVNPIILEFSKVKAAAKLLTFDTFLNFIKERIAVKSEFIDSTNYLAIVSIICELTKSTLFGEEQSNQVRELPIWPTRNGDFAAAKDCLIPGDFQDLLGLASLIDTQRIEKEHLEFLRDKLNVQLLSLDSYIRNVIPEHFSFESNPISTEKYRDLIQELANHLNSFENDRYLDVFSEIPFIKSTSGKFRPSTEMVLINAHVVDQLGTDLPFWADPVYLPDTKSVLALLESIGVRRKPSAKQLVQLIEALCEQTPNKENRSKVMRTLKFLFEKANGYSEIELKGALREIIEKKCLPSEGNFETWIKPTDLLLPDNRELFSTQTHLQVLDFSGVNFESRALITEFLGVKSEPELDDVISHIHAVNLTTQSLSRRVYVYLNRYAGRTSDIEAQRKISGLRYVGLFLHNDAYIKPSQMYSENCVVDSPWAFKLPSGLERFPELLKCLGVKSSPEVEDLISILGEIRYDLEESELGEPKQSYLKAYLQCWKALNLHSVQESFLPEQYVELQNSELFLNCDFEFVRLSDALVPDSQWFLGKFESHFSKYFLFETTIYQDLLAKLDCNYLSERIAVAIEDIALGKKSLEIVKNEIRNRAANIQTALSTLTGSEHVRDIWPEIQVIFADRISLSWNLNLNLNIENVSEDVPIFLDSKNETLYLTLDAFNSNEQVIWARVFKEILFYLFPKESEGTLPPVGGLLASLMSQSASEGTVYLNELGYETSKEESKFDVENVVVEEISLGAEQPEETQNQNSYSERVSPEESLNEFSKTGDSRESFSSERISETISSSTIHGEPKKDYKPLSSSTHTERQSSNGQPENKEKAFNPDTSKHKYSAGGGITSEQRRPIRSDSKQGEIRNAYVYSLHEPTDEGSRIQAEKMGNERVSRAIVVQHELSEGRNPEEMPGTTVGYDIESTEQTGDIRFIEVKSISGRWSGAGVTLSYSQINFASIKKEAFWLYIVESVDTENPRIYKIQNPVRYIRGFKFNDAWKELAIEIEASRNDADNSEQAITHDDLGSRVFHTERGECWLIGWLQIGQSIQVTLEFDNQDQVVLPLNITKMKKLSQ